MAHKYQRPEGRHRTEIEVLNSRFITTIDRATTVDDARSLIAEVRAEMPTASHHVYAFRIGYGNSVIEGMSDDGEPSGTSGPPTLAVLRGQDIGDIVLVTTRYFGGTKLGTGGLVRAYTDSAKTALETLPITWKAPRIQLGIDVPYSFFELVKRLILTYKAQIDDEIFQTDVTIILTILDDHVEAFINELSDLTHGQVNPIQLDTFDMD